jgi:tRNA pseudouridine13 synthase
VTRALPDWQRAHGGAALRALIRSSCEDFQVTEVLGFPPDGAGEHDFLWIEKKQQNTAWVASVLAKFAGIRAADVGFAGMKDRHAIARQWFSVRRPAGIKADWSRFDAAGIRILDVTRHRRKLRLGAHRGNHFRLALRETSDITGHVAERLTAIRDLGVPNYFGEQRFGHDASNLQLAEHLFAGRRLPRNRRSLALSAARSFLFNNILDRRVREGTWNTLLPGDSANLDGSGSVFRVELVDDELKHRLEKLDLHPTGALWGRGEPAVSGNVLELESGVVAANADLAHGLESQRVTQARRALRARVVDFSWKQEDEQTLWLEFCLGRGVFATAVLREFVQDQAI